MAFYKVLNNKIITAPNFVLHKDYELKKELKDTYTYPVQGWHWFETEDDAYAFFGIEKPKDKNK